jgi:hypothetical protein
MCRWRGGVVLARVIRSTGRPGGGFGRFDRLLAGQTHPTDLDQGTSAASPVLPEPERRQQHSQPSQDQDLAVDARLKAFGNQGRPRRRRVEI